MKRKFDYLEHVNLGATPESIEEIQSTNNVFQNENVDIFNKIKTEQNSIGNH